MLWLLNALAGPAYTVDIGGFDYPDWAPISRCRRDWRNCGGSADQRVNRFDYQLWSFRNEAIHAFDSESNDAGDDWTRIVCEYPHAPSPFACTARYLDTGERQWATRACELGDPGSCLLDTLDQLQADRDAALDELASQCRWGGAMACAWRLELLREGVTADARTAAFDDAFNWSQRACLHLHEGVACAATAKAMQQLEWTSQAEQLYAHACTRGYQPACDGTIDTPLREEQEPTLLGAAVFHPIKDRYLLPGRFPPHHSYWIGWGFRPSR